MLPNIANGTNATTFGNGNLSLDLPFKPIFKPAMMKRIPVTRKAADLSQLGIPRNEFATEKMIPAADSILIRVPGALDNTIFSEFFPNAMKASKDLIFDLNTYRCHTNKYDSGRVDAIKAALRPLTRSSFDEIRDADGWDEFANRMIVESKNILVNVIMSIRAMTITDKELRLALEKYAERTPDNEPLKLDLNKIERIAMYDWFTLKGNESFNSRATQAQVDAIDFYTSAMDNYMSGLESTYNLPFSMARYQSFLEQNTKRGVEAPKWLKGDLAMKPHCPDMRLRLFSSKMVDPNDPSKDTAPREISMETPKPTVVVTTVNGKTLSEFIAMSPEEYSTFYTSPTWEELEKQAKDRVAKGLDANDRSAMKSVLNQLFDKGLIAANSGKALGLDASKIHDVNPPAYFNEDGSAYIDLLEKTDNGYIGLDSVYSQLVNFAFYCVCRSQVDPSRAQEARYFAMSRLEVANKCLYRDSTEVCYAQDFTITCPSSWIEDFSKDFDSSTLVSVSRALSAHSFLASGHHATKVNLLNTTKKMLSAVNIDLSVESMQNYVRGCVYYGNHAGSTRMTIIDLWSNEHDLSGAIVYRMHPNPPMFAPYCNLEIFIEALNTAGFWSFSEKLGEFEMFRQNIKLIKREMHFSSPYSYYLYGENKKLPLLEMGQVAQFAGYAIAISKVMPDSTLSLSPALSKIAQQNASNSIAIGLQVDSFVSAYRRFLRAGYMSKFARSVGMSTTGGGQLAIDNNGE